MLCRLGGGTVQAVFVRVSCHKIKTLYNKTPVLLGRRKTATNRKTSGEGDEASTCTFPPNRGLLKLSPSPIHHDLPYPAVDCG